MSGTVIFAVDSLLHALVQPNIVVKPVTINNTITDIKRVSMLTTRGTIKKTKKDKASMLEKDTTTTLKHE
jgi:hypothetical protein